MGRHGLGLLSFNVGVPPEDLKGRIDLYRKGLEQAVPIGKVVNDTAATFTMVHCAETTEQAVSEARESFQWYAQTGVRQIATLGEWQKELKKEYKSYDYTRPISALRFLADLGLAYADLKGLILEKRKTIIANDLKGLTETTQRIEGLIGSNNRLEIGRMELVKKMAEKLALSGSKPTLLAIAECFEGAEREKLLDLRRRATEAITQVQRQNRINAELLKYSAELRRSGEEA